MKDYITKLINEILYDHLNKLRLEKLSISERIGLEVAIAKLKIIKELLGKFTID